MIALDERRRVRQAAEAYHRAPKLFFRKVLGVEILEEYQERVIQTVADNERTCIAACHDVGKSFLMARIAMWFLNTRPNSKVITTAPTFNQVEKILWSEIRAAHSKAIFPLGGKLNQTDWTFNPEWFALGFSPRNETSGDDGQGTQSSFQGFHAADILVIFDEATGIPLNIWTMAEGLLTSGRVKFVAIGNPTSSGSEFYNCFKSADWAKVYLSCFDSPNLKANGINNIKDLENEIIKTKAMSDTEYLKYVQSYKIVRPYLLTAKWVVQQARKWGLDHPLTISKILGKFPKASADTLVPLDVVERSQLRRPIPKASDRKIIGVDVARFGTDSSVLTSLHGLRQLGREECHKFDEVEVTGQVLNMVVTMGGVDIIVVDETGLGGAVVTLLKHAQINGTLSKDIEVRGVQFGAGVECDGPPGCKHTECEKAKYFNMKARMFGLLKADMADDNNGLALIDDSVYLDELPTIRYRYNEKGQMVIESKDAYRKRTGRSSPDNADSLALANFGRYDELDVGTFASLKSNEEKNTPTRAGGLRITTKDW